MRVNKHVFIVVLLGIFNQTRSLVELPAVEDNDILRTEVVIRTVTNNLFSVFRIPGVQQNPRLNQFSLVHNYFASLTLQDYNSLTEIAKLTRVDKANIGNVTADFIAILNELSDEDNVLDGNIFINGETIDNIYDINDGVIKLDYLKSSHANSDKILDINEKIIEILQKEENESANMTSHTTKKPFSYKNNEKLLDDIEVWSDPNKAKESARRIFHSHKTKITEFPFMASVQIFNKFQCSGSIITYDLVITAASCLQLAWNNRFYRENPQFLSVRIGSSYYERGGDNVAILEVYFHPSYNPKNLYNNIAIMRLLRRIKWHKKVKRIVLDRKENSLPLTTDGITVVGWGARTESNLLHGTLADQLGYAVLDIYPLYDCKEVYSKEYVSKKNFCAGFLSKGGGACNRDVGGPGIVDGILVGVISFGAPVCGTPDAPTVFTKVGFYYDWIEEIMEQEVPNIKQRTTLKTRMFAYSTKEFTTQYTVQPLLKMGESTLGAEIGVTATTPLTTQPTTLSDTDKKMYNEFLKTMFDNPESQENLGMVDEKKELKINTIATPISQPLWLRKPDADTTTASKSEPVDVTKIPAADYTAPVSSAAVPTDPTMPTMPSVPNPVHITELIPSIDYSPEISDNEMDLVNSVSEETTASLYNPSHNLMTLFDDVEPFKFDIPVTDSDIKQASEEEITTKKIIIINSAPITNAYKKENEGKIQAENSFENVTDNREADIFSGNFAMVPEALEHSKAQIEFTTPVNGLREGKELVIQNKNLLRDSLRELSSSEEYSEIGKYPKKRLKYADRDAIMTPLPQSTIGIDYVPNRDNPLAEQKKAPFSLTHIQYIDNMVDTVWSLLFKNKTKPPLGKKPVKNETEMVYDNYSYDSTNEAQEETNLDNVMNLLNITSKFAIRNYKPTTTRVKTTTHKTFKPIKTTTISFIDLLKEIINESTEKKRKNKRIVR